MITLPRKASPTAIQRISPYFLHAIDLSNPDLAMPICLQETVTHVLLDPTQSYQQQSSAA